MRGFQSQHQSCVTRFSLAHSPWLTNRQLTGIGATTDVAAAGAAALSFCKSTNFKPSAPVVVF